MLTCTCCNTDFPHGNEPSTWIYCPLCGQQLGDIETLINDDDREPDDITGKL
jgi:hypothetical protein